MARKRRRAGAAAAKARAAGEGGAPARDIRPYIYAGLDLLFAALYLTLFLWVVPNQHGWAQAILLALPASAAVMAAGMLAGKRWGWRLAAGGCAALLLLAVALLALVLSGAAVLAGVYGAFGLAASVVSLVVAALIVELVALLPAFQLKYLMTRAGRRRFGQEPLG